MPSSRQSKAPRKGLVNESASSIPTKPAKRAKAPTTEQEDKGREAIANNQKRTMRRHVARKSRVQPLTKSSGRGRGKAHTRRRKEAGG